MAGCKVRLLLAFTNCLDENINQLSDVRTPFLIIHGSEDRLCNPVGSELLFRFICCYTLAQCGSGWCLSRIPDPDFYPLPGSRISDPGSRIQKQLQKRGVKKTLFSSIYLYPQISQNVKLFYFELMKKKFLAKFQRIIELFTQKYEFGIQGSKRYRIPDPDPQHCFSRPWCFITIGGHRYCDK